MKHGSLFSGIGGFDLAAEWMGWENVFHCEINKKSREKLNHYWPLAKSYADIKSTNFSIWRGQLDIISGGDPCQPSSVAGLGKGTADNRIIYRLRRVGHYINGKEFGLSLITPTSTEVIKSPEAYAIQKKKNSHWKGNNTKFTSLGSQLIYGLLIPTPTVNDSKNSTLPKSQEFCRKGYQGTLVSALIHMGISPGTKLNPELYECLMGYPKGWTIPNGTNVLKNLETP